MGHLFCPDEQSTANILGSPETILSMYETTTPLHKRCVQHEYWCQSGSLGKQYVSFMFAVFLFN